MKQIFLLFFVFNTTIAFAHRENTYYLKGKIGDKEVGLRLDEFGEKCFIRYFDIRDKKDQLLEGDILDNNLFKLQSFTYDSTLQQRIMLDSLLIMEVENHHWEGTLFHKNGEISNVNLEPIVVDSLHHPYEKGIKNYDELRINPFAAYRTIDISFEPLVTQKIGKHFAIQWYRETVSGIHHFRVLPHKKLSISVDSINHFLELEQMKLMDAKMSCIEEGNQSKFQCSIEVHFLNAHYISYTINIQSDCMGIGNEKITSHYNRSIKTAKTIMLEDIYWFGEKEKPQMRDGGQNWYTYRYSEFGQKIMSLLLESKPNEMNNAANSCDYKNVKRWQFPTWFLTLEGLYLEGSTLMESPKCRDTSSWSTLPWKKIKPYYVGD